MFDFVDWAWRLLALPLLAWYPSHLRCLIVNGTHDFVSLWDFVMVRSWQLLPLGHFHDFCSVNESIIMIMFALLTVMRTLLRPVPCCFIGCRTWHIVPFLCEDLTELFRWRVRLLHKATYIVKFG